MAVSPAGGLQDTAVDKALYLFLITAGLYVLSRRQASLRFILRNNKCLFLFFLYLGISVLWSEAPFTSFKRWIKDFGNVVMVAVILTEEDPLEAVKAFLARCTYLAIPLSVLVTKYYPEISRRYDIWTNEPGFVGISTGKNLLGMTLFVCALSMFWLLLGLRDDRSRTKDKTAFGRYSILFMMTAWLLYKAKSSTAVSCTVLGSGLLLAMKFPVLRAQVKRLGIYVAGTAVLVVLLQTSGLWNLLVKEFAETVGRDPSLHGRAEIWEAVLKEDINPLIGTGFYSFWSEERNKRLSETYYYQLGEAHNGYIETYLNSGLIGLALFAAMIIFGAKDIKRDVLKNGVGFGALRLAILLMAVLYGLSESIFDRLVHVWFALLLVIMVYPKRVKAELKASPTRQIRGERAVFADQNSLGSFSENGVR